MFFFWWRAGSEKLLKVMEVTVRWQQSDSWQKRREKRVWHQQRDWQKWNWVHLTVAAYAYRPLTRRDSSSCPFAGTAPGFLPSLWSQRLGIICIVKKNKKKSIAFLIEGLTYDVWWNDASNWFIMKPFLPIALWIYHRGDFYSDTDLLLSIYWSWTIKCYRSEWPLSNICLCGSVRMSSDCHVQRDIKQMSPQPWSFIFATFMSHLKL